MKKRQLRSSDKKSVQADDVNYCVAKDIKQRYDAAWKKSIEMYFRDFITFFFPTIAQQIDWNHGFQFLDKELQKITRQASSGIQLADKLVQVWTTNQQEAWVLVHVEFQNSRQKEFAHRMYTYNYRIYDYYQKPVISLAVLGDNSPTWKPDSFNSQLWDCEISFKFPVVKIIDYAEKWSELENSLNPFAIITMAHIQAIKYRHNDIVQFAAEVKIIDHLYKKGFKQEDIRNLLDFIDLLFALPQKFEEKIHEITTAHDKENFNMEHLSIYEKKAMEKGFEQGIEQGREEALQESLKVTLEVKFGKKAVSLFLPIITKLKSTNEMLAFQRKITAAKSIQELKAGKKKRTAA